MKKLNWLCLLACLCATQARANSISIFGNGPPDAGFNETETTTAVWLFGHNTNPLAVGTLSISFLDVSFLSYFGDTTFDNAALWGFTATVEKVEFPDWDAVGYADANGGGVMPCKSSVCTSSIDFYIPVGSLALKLPVDVAMVLNDVGTNDVSIGSPAWGLTLSVPDNLTLSLRPVPLPPTLPLLATGLSAFSLLGWRRNRRRRLTDAPEAFE
jgi:hypothetical protein